MRLYKNRNQKALVILFAYTATSEADSGRRGEKEQERSNAITEQDAWMGDLFDDVMMEEFN